MKFIDTSIAEVKIIEPDVFGDHRGWFMETWSQPKYDRLHFIPVQDNESFTAKRGTLRGIHFQQTPMAQAKIVRVTAGAVLDVAVDLRKGSPTYLKWVSVELSAAGCCAGCRVCHGPLPFPSACAAATPSASAD